MLEVRLQGGKLDEVVASGPGFNFHLEQMGNTGWWLEVNVDGKRVAVWLNSARAMKVHYEQDGAVVTADGGR